MKPHSNVEYISIGILFLSLLFYAYKKKQNDIEGSIFIMVLAFVVLILWAYNFYVDRYKKES